MRYLFPDGSEASARMAAELDAIYAIPQSQWTAEQKHVVAAVEIATLYNLKRLALEQGVE